MDLGPTILELAGVPVPGSLEARTMLPALQGGKWAGRDRVSRDVAAREMRSERARKVMNRRLARAVGVGTHSTDVYPIDRAHIDYSGRVFWRSRRFQ